MKCDTYSIRHGYDKKQCLVHARCCRAPDLMLATAQYLNVEGTDAFYGILTSLSIDDGKTWTEFEPQKELLPIDDGEYETVGCDATPMYHKKTDSIILIGRTFSYKKGSLRPVTDDRDRTFYSVFDKEKKKFGQMKFLEMPVGYEYCINGSGQSIELENGELLIPVCYRNPDEQHRYSMAIKCSFDGENVKLLEMGKPLTIHIAKGLFEPSLVCHKGVYYMTLRNRDCALVAKSDDGLNYTDLQLWKWEDGSILQNYNTQQHWMQVGDELYLVYTRRAENNGHVFRHRAPLFAARVENMRLVKDSEFIVVGEKGARLGNFGVTPYKENGAVVMAAEWMQPKGCEQYGSDNNIYVAKIYHE